MHCFVWCGFDAGGREEWLARGQWVRVGVCVAMHSVGCGRNAWQVCWQASVL
jgi:hypothetical protein